MVNILFKEEQRIRQNMLWLILLMTPVVFFWAILIYQLVTGKLVGDRPLENLPLSCITIVYTLCVVWSFLSVKLTTVIDDNKLAYGWNIPTAELNEIPLSEIGELSVIKYRFVGYGYRLSRLYGTVYNVGGNKGLQVTTKKGEKVLIGTVRPEELETIVTKLKKAP